jgi:hypothetical protein
MEEDYVDFDFSNRRWAKGATGERATLGWHRSAALALAAAGALSFYFTRITPSLPPMKVSRVTSYPGLETEPALSPDGKMVAFVWDGENQDNRDIYVKLVDEGVPVRLTHDPADDLSPTWSPDGRVYSQYRVRDLAGRLENVAGSSERIPSGTGGDP